MRGRQLGIGLLARRDVFDLTNEVQGSAVPVVNEGRVEPDPDHLAVLAQVAFLQLNRSDLASQQPVVLRRVRFPVIGVRDLLVCLAE
jgi:hypothetical protein